MWLRTTSIATPVLPESKWLWSFHEMSRLQTKKHTTQHMIHHHTAKVQFLCRKKCKSAWKYQLPTYIRLCFQESWCQECASLGIIWLITFGGSPNLPRLESHCSSVGQIVAWPRDAGMQNLESRQSIGGQYGVRMRWIRLTNLQDFTYLHLIRLHHMTWCFIAYEGTRVPNHGLGNVYRPVQSSRVPERCQKHHV